MPNTSFNIKNTTVKPAKKSTEPAPARIPRAPTALTPEQESAVILRNIVLADQERLQRSNAWVNNGSPTTNEHESTETGRSHSILQAPDNTNYIVTNKLEQNISHRIPFSPIIPCKRNPPFASYDIPTKKQRVRSDSNSNNIKNKHNNQVDKPNTFKMSDKSMEDPHTNNRVIVGTAMKRALQRMPPFCHLTDTSKDMVKTVNSETLLHPNSHFTFSLADDSRNIHSDDGDKTSKDRLSNASLLTRRRPLLFANERFQWWLSTLTTIVKAQNLVRVRSEVNSGRSDLDVCRIVC